MRWGNSCMAYDLGSKVLLLRAALRTVIARATGKGPEGRECEPGDFEDSIVEAQKVMDATGDGVVEAVFENIGRLTDNRMEELSLLAIPPEDRGSDWQPNIAMLHHLRGTLLDALRCQLCEVNGKGCPREQGELISDTQVCCTPALEEPNDGKASSAVGGAVA